MLHGVEVDVVQVGGVVAVVADGVFPEAALPDGAFVAWRWVGVRCSVGGIDLVKFFFRARQRDE
jgi:hypothetical protein